MGIETAIIAAAVIGTAASVGTSLYSSHQQEKMQKKTLQAQEDAVKAAEEKAKNAENLAAQEAVEKARKVRLAQTQTILTTPLGVTSAADVNRTTLGGQ